MTFERAVQRIQQERKRQDGRYGEHNHANFGWFLILSAEVQALKDILWTHDTESIIAYIVQVATVCVAWLEKLEE